MYRMSTCESECIAVIHTSKLFCIEDLPFELHLNLCLHTCIVIAMWFRTHDAITKLSIYIIQNHLTTIFAFDPLQYIKLYT